MPGTLADRAPWVAELVHLCNSKVAVFGALSLDAETGGVAYSVGADLREHAISGETVSRLLNSCARPLRVWRTAFSFIIAPHATPTKALNAALVVADAPEDAVITKGVRKLLLTVATGGAPADVTRGPSSTTLSVI